MRSWLSYYRPAVIVAAFTGCLLFAAPVFPQGFVVTGTVKDEITQVPIRDVNIKVNGTNLGTVTDNAGRFTLRLPKIPAAITLSCVGYETVYFDIPKNTGKPLAMIMRTRVYGLKEVEIPSARYGYVFRDPDYSVLDYEIMDDNILLLVFRYQLKRSELIMLDLSGDTVAIAALPEQKPKCLFRDFLGNVHYISTRGNAFQCLYNDTTGQVGFMYQTTFDSLRMMVQPFLFVTGDNCYFQEFSPDGFGMRIGYFDKEHHKQYIRLLSGESTREKFNRDMQFNSRWNECLGNTASKIKGAENLRQPTFAPDDLRALKQFSYGRINAPLVKLGEEDMAVFNFSEDRIEMMDPKGKVYRSVPISFHKEPDDNLLASMISAFVPVTDWKWCGKILVDDYYRIAYTTFRKNGMTRIRKIDLETGKLTATFDLPFPFPEKIQVYKGVAYFLNKNPGQSENRKLVKFKL
jgi:hypothetical protein